jgi:hypothetical protein
VHFYHESVPAFVEDPHDHRYDFVSTVKRGCLENRVWKLTAGDDHEVSYVDCRAGDGEAPAGFRTGLIELGSFRTFERSGYHMNSETLHTVKPIFDFGPVVTLVQRELPFKDRARSVKRVDAPSLCPFSRSIPDDELWEIVRDCLD